MIEVEAKFLVPDEATLMGSLRPHFDDATMTEYVQADEYFNHPCRDFNITDEALRIRKCNDRLEGLPLYAELEITCDPLERDAATATILRLAERLALGQSERRSYLELLGFR